MPLSLISIPTDTHALDGLYYEPDAPPRGAAMFLHGNCMNFYTGPARVVPPALVSLGYACLVFNRRGHDMVATTNSRAITGGAFQMTKDAIADNRYVADWLKARGFAAPIVVGHSNGGMLAAQHVADHPDTPALVLLSAHLGGKSIVPHASKVGLLGGDRIDEVGRQAREMVAAGRGGELMLLPGWWHVLTAESYLDYCSELPDVLALAPRIKCPTLYIRGDKEPAHIYPAEEFAARAGGRCDVRIVKDCDHFYGGRENTISEIVTGWLQDLGLDHVLAKT
jgi:pimeloyl-ACP methyl ester carboxylesterase